MSSFSECPDVRFAIYEDLTELMRLAELAHEENEHWQKGFNRQKVYDTFARLIPRQTGLLAVIGDKGQELKGTLVMTLDRPWYSDDLRLLELALFVDPEHRRSTYAKQLMIFSKKASDNLQLDLTIGVFTNKQLERKERLYDRQYRPAGKFYHYVPTGA